MRVQARAAAPRLAPGSGLLRTAPSALSALPPSSSRLGLEPPRAPGFFRRAAASADMAPALFAAVDFRRPPQAAPRVFTAPPTTKWTYMLKMIVPPVTLGDPGLLHSQGVELVSRMAAASAGVGAAARAANEANPVHTQASLEAASEAGVVTQQQEIKNRLLKFEIGRLVSVLPLHAIAKATACTVEALLDKDTDRLARHLLSRGRPAKWAPGTVRDAHNNWVRFMAWLERNGIEHDGWIFDAIDLGDYLFEVDASARAKAGANKAKAAAKDAEAASRAAANGSAPPPKRKYQDGSTAVTGVVKNLHLLRTHFGFTLPIEEADSPRLPGSKATQATPALTLGIVFRLYRFVNVVAEVQRRGTKQPFERLAHASVAAAILFATFSCNRCEQANSCFFDGEHDGFLHGVILLDKNPNPDKKQARPFWMRIAGPDGGVAWFEFLKWVLRDVETGCFVFRDYAGSNDGDPSGATAFINSPLCGTRLVKAIACVISRVCGISMDDAMRWAKHACRHFLMECSGARGVHSLRAIEIGRWSGSTAQDPDLTPSQRQNRRHQLAAGVMPENYAPLAKVTRVCEILGAEMAALEKLWTRVNNDPIGFESLPVFGGFEPLGEWAADPKEV